MITARLSKKNQISVPSAVRRVLDIGPGDDIAFDIDGETIRLIKPGAIPVYHIDELIAGIDEGNLPEESFDDGPHGEEIL